MRNDEQLKILHSFLSNPTFFEIQSRIFLEKTLPDLLKDKELDFSSQDQLLEELQIYVRKRES